MPSKLRAENDVHGQVVNTVACTVKIKIPDTLVHRPNGLLPVVSASVARMLRNRDESSSRYYPELPCIISKSLIANYQRNRKYRAVSNVVIPICGDKERQIKLEGISVRIPALFQKETPAAPRFQPTGMVEADRNSMGHVATLADPQTGKVLHLGFNPAPTKAACVGARRTCSDKGKTGCCAKSSASSPDARSTKDYAATHRRALAIEDPGQIRAKGSQICFYTERSQYFFQLLQFIAYKAALRGVEVIQVHPAYFSHECSRCHGLTKPTDKKFVCWHCGHKDHRDANAAFTLSCRVEPIGGLARDSAGSRSALLVEPFLGAWARL
jgi:hypothetical protein